MNFFIKIKRFFIINYIKFLKQRDQKLFIGVNSDFEIVKEIKKKKLLKAFIVSSKSISNIDASKNFINSLKLNNIDYCLFDEANNEPDMELITKGASIYKEQECDFLIAIGGGSVIDCCKVIGLKVTNPHKSIHAFKRLFLRFIRMSPPIMAIPTTAGTGSENTFYALITNNETKEKHFILTDKFIPCAVSLNPLFTITLPKNITIFTGLDALTHGIESYISDYSKYFSNDKKLGLEAIKMVFDNLAYACKEPSNLKYRENMLVAAYKAGLAFRRISVGYVHSFAHRMGEFYHIQHGLANAIILPTILDFIKEDALLPLSEISLYLRLGDKQEDPVALANKLITKIKELNSLLNIPSTIKEIKEEDYDLLIKRIMKEGNKSGSPRLINKKECKMILETLMGKKDEK